MKNSAHMLAWTMIALALTTSQSHAQSAYTPYTFTTLAGNPGFGSTDGTGSAARFSIPFGVAVDAGGNVYVADTSNSTIRKVTPAGVVTTLAGVAGNHGFADGTGSAARFNQPVAVAVDSACNVYVADQLNQTIRKVTPAGVVTTLAGLPGFPGYRDGAGSAALFWYPTGVAVDSAGIVYVADNFNFTIRKVTPAGVVTTLAGLTGSAGSEDGMGSDARFGTVSCNFSCDRAGPSGVAVDDAGNVYVADSGNATIRKVTPAGMVTTMAGLAGSYGSADGTGSNARFGSIYGVAVDSAGNVYVAEDRNDTIRKVTPAGMVTTLAGLAGSFGSADGTGSAARFSAPYGVAADSAGNVYVADTANSTIRKVTATGDVTTLAGLAGGDGHTDGTGSDARFSSPTGVAVDSASNLFVADRNNNTIRKVTSAGVVTTLAGRGGAPGRGDGTGSDARFNAPSGVAVDSAGNVFVADGNNNTIRKVMPAGVVTTLAGLAQFDGVGNPVDGSADGTGSDARFAFPSGVAVDAEGTVYVADSGNHTIRKVTPLGAVTTLAGLAGSSGNSDGIGNAARFWSPSGVAVDSAGNVFVADRNNNTIRKITAAREVTTLAGNASVINQFGYPLGGTADGTGSDARFSGPSGVAVDSAGNVYVADAYNKTIRKITPARVVTTLAGNASVIPFGFTFGGNADGTGSDARFSVPSGVAVDSAGNVYVADFGNFTIRKGSPAPVAFRLFGPRIGFNGGQFGLFLTGSAGQSVVVEGSTDLLSWLPIWTNTFAGALNFVDPQSGVYSNRFYRARLP